MKGDRRENNNNNNNNIYIIYFPIYLFIHVFIHLIIHLFIHSFICIFLFLSIDLFIFVFIYLLMHLSKLPFYMLTFSFFFPPSRRCWNKRSTVCAENLPPPRVSLTLRFKRLVLTSNKLSKCCIVLFIDLFIYLFIYFLNILCNPTFFLFIVRIYLFFS